MNVKKLLLAALAGFVVQFSLGGLWHALIMAGKYDELLTPVLREAPTPNIVFIAAGYVVLSLLMAYMYPQGYKGGPPVKEGMKFGILMGLLWVIPLHLVFVGALNFPMGTVYLELWHVVEQAIGGIVIALVYGTEAS